jgi:tyrosinase
VWLQWRSTILELVFRRRQWIIAGISSCRSRQILIKYSFTNSPIFDPVYGFGGNGAYIANWTGFFGNSTPTNSGGGCIQDGPFVNYNLSVGPGTSVTNHCIVRNFNSNFAYLGNSTQVANTTKQPNFEAFRQESGGAFKPPPFKIHDSGHGMISGEMGNVFSSPGGMSRHIS